MGHLEWDDGALEPEPKGEPEKPRDGAKEHPVDPEGDDGSSSGGEDDVSSKGASDDGATNAHVLIDEAWRPTANPVLRPEMAAATAASLSVWATMGGANLLKASRRYW